jgi:hypothetical protein
MHDSRPKKLHNSLPNSYSWSSAVDSQTVYVVWNFPRFTSYTSCALNIALSASLRTASSFWEWKHIHCACSDAFRISTCRFLGVFAKLWKRLLASYFLSLYLSVRLSVHMKQLGSHWRDFHELWYLNIFLEAVDKIQFSLQHDKKTGTLHEQLCTFMISRWFFLRMWNVSEKNCRNKTHISCSITLLWQSWRYEIIYKNMVQSGWPQITIKYGACTLHVG